MPVVWEKSVKLYQKLWRRVGRVFCDGCGMVITDGHYWRWSVVYISEDQEWITEEGDSHINTRCIGVVLEDLLSRARTREEIVISRVFG